MAEILFFGRMGDVSGQMSERVSLPETIETVTDLRRWMENRFDQTGAFEDPTVRVAVNNAIVTENFRVSDSDEIAFMPPVGGG